MKGYRVKLDFSYTVILILTNSKDLVNRGMYRCQLLIYYYYSIACKYIISKQYIVHKTWNRKVINQQHVLYQQHDHKK